MAPPKVFLTGVTGYIGGDALHVLYEAHPDWQYTCLVRSEERGAAVAAKHASVRLVYGDLSSASMITEEAAKADIVLHFANADDEPSANAIAAGLSQHSPSSPGYWIHTSGTGILCYTDMEISSFGESSSKIWDDVADITSIRDSIPSFAPHRNIDQIVFAAASGASDRVRTAIVCPPCIYGAGRGAGNKRSIQLPELSRCFLERKQGFMVGEGKSRWGFVHVRDLSQVYLKLAEAAAEGGGKASWESEGYYFAEDGEHAWGDVSAELAKEAHKAGFLPSADIVSVSADETDKMVPHGSFMWGANSRCRAQRARQLLGWKPAFDKVDEELSATLTAEADKLGLVKHHAAKAAGDA